MTQGERRTILSVANDIRNNRDVDVGNDMYWSSKGVVGMDERRNVVGRARALVNAEEDYASADPNRYTLRGLILPQYQGDTNEGGPLGTPTATVTMKIELLFSRGGSVFRTIQYNPGWDDTLADINQNLIEAADELQDRYKAEQYVLRLESVRIY